MSRPSRLVDASKISCGCAVNLGRVVGGNSRVSPPSVRVANGETRNAEVHWYEAHGIGRRKMKIKRFLS